LNTPIQDEDRNRRARTRRLTLVLFAVAIAFYAAFIGLSVLHGRA